VNTPSRIVTPGVGVTALRPQLLSEFVGQAQAAVSRSAEENAEKVQLIRLGLKELAK
jgi:hypothetical protein